MLSELHKPHLWICLASPTVRIEYYYFPYLFCIDTDVQIPRYLPGHLFLVGQARALRRAFQ